MMKVSGRRHNDDLKVTKHNLFNMNVNKFRKYLIYFVRIKKFKSRRILSQNLFSEMSKFT